MVLSALAEGLDASVAERVFGYRQATITTWLSRAGEHAQTLHERFFCHLRLPHLQLDELRTRLRSANQILWLWLAIDPLTKILPVLELGPRTQHMAHRVIHSLRLLLVPGCIPLFTSDGLNLYFYALTAHFGHWLQVGRRGRNVLRWQVATNLIYGQVKKCYRRRKLVRVTYLMRLGTEEALKSTLRGLGLSGRLNTAFIERVTFRASPCSAAHATGASTCTRGQPSGPTLPATDSRHGDGENHSTMDGAGSFVPPLIAGALHPKGSMKDVRRRPVKEQEAARGRGKQGQVRGSTAGSIPSFESNEKKSSPTSVLRGRANYPPRPMAVPLFVSLSTMLGNSTSYEVGKSYTPETGVYYFPSSRPLSFPLCWLLGTSVRKIHAFLRTDVPSCQHSSFRLISTTIKLTEVS